MLKENPGGTTMANIDKDLAGALRQAKTKRMHFALVEKKQGEGTLIVTKSPTPQSAIAEAQRDLGGGKIFKGECFLDDKTGELIFETDTEPPSVNTLKAVIKRDAGLTLKVNSRKALIGAIADLLNEDRTAEAEKRLADIQKGSAFKQAMSQGGLVADALNKQVENVKKLIDSKDFKNAGKAMDELEKLAESPTEDL